MNEVITTMSNEDRTMWRRYAAYAEVADSPAPDLSSDDRVRMWEDYWNVLGELCAKYEIDGDDVHAVRLDPATGVIYVHDG